MPPLKIAPAREAERPKKRRSEMSHDERAAEIVDHLRDAIESRKDGNEKPGGMSYRDWRKLAQKVVATLKNGGATDAVLALAELPVKNRDLWERLLAAAIRKWPRADFT